MKIRKAKGFTLIELMIVVAIIGILAAIAVPKFADLIRKSNEGATKGNLGALRSALSIYFGDNDGMYPAGADAGTTAMGVNLVPKYIKALPVCYAAGNHVKQTGEYNTNYYALAVAASDTGVWGYDGAGQLTHELAMTAAGRANWGSAWVACTHTDTRSATWSSY